MKHDNFDTKNDSIKYVRSLNVDHRRKELMKITEENLALLKRIQEKQPTYNSMKWIQDRKQNELYCKNICQYDYVLTNSSTTDSMRSFVFIFQKLYILISFLESSVKSPSLKQKTEAEEDEITRLLEESARLREELTKQQQELQQDQALLQKVEELEKLQENQSQEQQPEGGEANPAIL